MIMEATSSTSSCSSTSSYYHAEKRDLEQLLEAFGSKVSLEDIASAYYQAERDVNTAAELLCNPQGRASSSSTCSSKDNMLGENASSEQSSDSLLERPDYVVLSKLKKHSASMGTVSSVIGREYAAKPRPPQNGSCKVAKPLKITSDELSISQIWGERQASEIPGRDETMHKDVEDFLFIMLGDGFQLDKNVIRDVLGSCGYDVKESMDKLLDLSASTLRKSDDLLEIANQNTKEKYTDLGDYTCQEQSKQRVFTARGKAKSKGGKLLESSAKDKLQKELLEALFTAPDRFEEAPKISMREIRRARDSSRAVVEPLKCTISERTIVTAKSHASKTEDEETEDSYPKLREAVNEHWTTMKEYYKAAVDAFAEGDRTRANKFLEEGHFFMQKARSADDKSAEKLYETRDDEADELSLDFQEHEPREAIRLLRVQLTALSGIPSIQYLKVTVAMNKEDSKGVARKLKILKFLEKEKIKWTEEEEGRIIVIRVDEIDPERLSFR